MLSYPYRIIRGVENHGLKKHKTVVFHAGEFYSNPIFFSSKNCPAKVQYQARPSPSLIELQAAILAHRDTDITLNKQAAQTQISSWKLTLQYILGENLDTSGKNYPFMPAFFRIEC